MRRGLYEPDHEQFRAAVREFVAREVTPNLERWDEQRLVDRQLWQAAGKQGVIGLSVPEEFGGGGVGADFRYRNVVIEELNRVFAASLASGFSLQDDIVVPYLVALGTNEQKQRWLPGMAAGDTIGAIAMTEPGTGSDLRGIRTAGTRVDGGWRVSGSKTFITSGIHADLVVVVVRTDPAGGAQGFSLLVVERKMDGFSRGRKLRKIGLHAQDTAELVFDDVFVPEENLLGSVGGGFGQLIHHLPLERLAIAAQGVAAADAALATTVDYVRTRTAFGQRIGDFQNSSFVLADLATGTDVARAYLDQAIRAFNAGDLSVVDAAKAKLWATELQNRVLDACVQLHGGYGYMEEYPVARAFVDARVQRIYGGTSEIMRQIIGKDLIGRAETR